MVEGGVILVHGYSAENVWKRRIDLIKVLVLDVDGTMTDGKLNISNSGELFKSFSVLDGYAIVNILADLNIAPVILTGRKSEIVERRAEELGIKAVLQGSSRKLETLEKYLKKVGISWDEVAYMGDDLNDYECMIRAKIKACPWNAVKEIKEISDYITKQKGGDGAVREFIEWLRDFGITIHQDI